MRLHFAKLFAALFLCQILALPAQATLGADFYRPNSLVARAEYAQAAIDLGIVSKGDGFAKQRLIATSSHTSGDLVYQKMQGQGNQQESGHANLLNVGQLNINAAKVNVPLAQSLQQLTQQPGMDYLNQLLHDPQLQGKVNWSAVELAHQHWDYEQQGLTQAGAVIVAIVVAYFTLGAASGVGVTAAEGAGFATTTTAAGTTVMATTAGTMFAGATTAAITTLATQASISLINNQGDLGKTLNDLGSSDNVKGLVTAMLTGGALAGLNFSPTGQPTVNGGAQSFSSQLGQNLQAGIARSLISSAINGGSLEDSLKTAITAALIDTGAAQGAFVIGSNVTGLANKLAHALAGCAAGAARAGAGEGCAAGAIGAAVGEMAAEAYGKRADTVEFAAMISGIAAAVAGGDASQINLASQAGANAAANNFCAHNGCFNRRFDWNDAVDQWKNGNGVTVKDVNASELNLTDATYTKNPNGTYQIHTSISFDTGAIYGTVTGALNPDGTLSIRPDVYDFDQKNPLNAQTPGEFWRITFRDGLTALGAAMNGVGTPFRIEFSGSIPAPKELPK